jgi:Lar family restriction alleviation protein
MTDIELEKCPFCNSKHLTHTNHGLPSARAWVTCESCGATGPFGKGNEEAAAAWNKRAEPIMWVSNYSMPGTPSLDELQHDNKWLRDKNGEWQRKCGQLEAENKRLKYELGQAKSADPIIALQAANDELAMKNRLMEYQNKQLKEQINQLVGSTPIITMILGGKYFLMPEVSANAVSAEIERLEWNAGYLRMAMREARKVLKDITTPDGLMVDMDKIREARRILKSALKGEG